MGNKPSEGLAVAAAHGCAAHHHAAGATGLHAGGHAIAAALDHVATALIAAGAGDGAAILGHFALAHPHHEVARANHHAVHHAAATDHAAGHHGAEVLHHGAGGRIGAGAGDLHSTRDFLHLERATRDHHHVRRHGGGCAAHPRGPHAWHSHRRTLHHHRAGHDYHSNSWDCRGDGDQKTALFPLFSATPVLKISENRGNNLLWQLLSAIIPQQHD